MRLPLYVVLVGEPPGDVRGRDAEQSPGFVLDMVNAANGRAAAPLAQTLASFFADDGLLLRKFVYRVRAARGPAAKIEPIVRRIAAPPRPRRRAAHPLLLRPAAPADPGRAARAPRALVPRPGRPRDRRARARPAGARGRRPPAPLERRHLVRPGPEPRRRRAHRRRHVHAAAGRARPGRRRPRHRRARPARRRARCRSPSTSCAASLETATDSGTREEKIHALNLDYAARSLQADGGRADPRAPPPARARASPRSSSCARRRASPSTSRCAARLLEPRRAGRDLRQGGHAPRARRRAAGCGSAATASSCATSSRAGARTRARPATTTACPRCSGSRRSCPTGSSASSASAAAGSGS